MPDTNFADFVKEAREKKKREALAQQILGSQGRKSNGAGALPNTRNAPQKPSLASRMSSSSGVAKSRSSSAKPAAKPTAGNVDGKWQHDLHKLNNPQGPAQRKLHRTASASQIDRNTRTFNKFRSVLQDNVADTVPATQSGFNIKGVATERPCTVIASNFAPGTTAADIEAVMAPMAAQRDGRVLSCRLLSSTPTVMVEMSIDKRDGAQNIIDTFNNQVADGRKLYVYLKDVPNAAAAHGRPAPRAPRNAPQTSYDDMEVDTNRGGQGGGFYEAGLGFSDTTRREPPRGPRRRY